MTKIEIRKLKVAFTSRLVFYWRDKSEPAYRILGFAGDMASLVGGGAIQLHECEKGDFVTGTIFR